MLLGAKRIAFLGLLLALCIFMIILGSILEWNTLFFLAAASFCIGIAIRECGLRMGLGFFIASIVLSFILSPNKLYCITYGGMGLYLLLMEYAWIKIATKTKLIKRNLWFWLAKYSIFNMIYIPILLFFPNLIFIERISTILLLLFFIIGQLCLFIYDRAYLIFQATIWGKLRKHLQIFH